MTSKTSKSIPFLAMLMVTLSVIGKALGFDIPIESLIPFWTVLAGAGAAKAAVTKAAAIRRAIPQDIEEKIIATIKEQVKPQSKL